MNSTFNKGSDTDFNAAVKMSGGKYDYSELVEFLSSGVIAERQFAALQLEEIKSAEDAAILISNLIGQNGKVREAAAAKITELIKIPSCREHFLNMQNYETVMKALIDINSNVCRQIVNLSETLAGEEKFSSYFAKELPARIKKALEKAQAFKPEDKKHTINKTVFKLYWYLEALYIFAEKIPSDSLKEILLKSGGFEDYTIREKAAKILSKKILLNDSEILLLREKLKNDENYYVRNLLD